MVRSPAPTHFPAEDPAHGRVDGRAAIAERAVPSRRRRTTVLQGNRRGEARYRLLSCAGCAALGPQISGDNREERRLRLQAFHTGHSAHHPAMARSGQEADSALTIASTISFDGWLVQRVTGRPGSAQTTVPSLATTLSGRRAPAFFGISASIR